MDLNWVIKALEGNAGLLRAMLAEATDLAAQPANVPNHAAWITGHLTLVRASLANLLGQPADPVDMRKYGPGSSPTPHAADYPTKTELLAAFNKAHAALVSALKTTKPETLAAQNPIEQLRAAAPTIGDLVVMMTASHDGLHLGQLSVWRRAMGLNRVIG